MVYDIIIICIFILLVILGIYRGAARMLIGLALSFVSFIAASWLGKLIASGIYSAFIGPAVHGKVSDAVQQFMDGTANNVVSNLPWWLTGPLNLSGQDLSAAVTGSSAQTAAAAGDTVNAVVQPIIVGIISILLTLLLFFVIRFVLSKLLMKPVLALFRLPIINAVDRTIGGILGAAEGILIICMLAYILKLVLPYFGPNVVFPSESTIYNSFIFYHFYSGNIFTVFASWIH